MEMHREKFSSGLVDLDVKGGRDGCLVPLESGTEVVPFPIKRVYYIYGVDDGLRRGFHAHKTLKQLIVCVSGQCSIDLDDSYQRQSFCLDSPDKGLQINEPLWREMYDFSSDCVLVILASEHYEPSDYINSFREFKEFIKR